MVSQENRLKVDPDLDFIQDVLDSGGESLKKCFQCGTCSVVCNLAPENNPFPRQEMIWAQWGLKDKLIDDPNLWICHQCSDCTAYCPRGAQPGDVLGAVRKKAVESLAWPSFMGKAVGDPQYLPILALAPAIILGVVLLINGVSELAGTPVIYGKMITHIQMNVIFPFFSAVAGLAFLIGLNRLWRGASGQSIPEFLTSMDRPRIIQAVIDVATRVITHSDFEKCEANKWRKIAHMLVFYAFFGLLLTTALAIVVLVLHEYLHSNVLGVYPLRPLHPIKWLANASAAALIAGSWLMIQNRREKAESDDMRSSYFDLLFLYVLFGVAVSGLLSEILRYAGVPLLAYPVYFIHLVLVFMLLIYSPYSKFAHLIYRGFALIFVKYEELGQEEVKKDKEVAAEAEAQAA